MRVRRGVPILGICYGQQDHDAAQLGGEVEAPTTASSAAPSSRS
jgi:GMP synthase-like glutamine amidotransferase